MLIYEYNASYGLYTVRDAETLEPLTTTVFLSEAEYLCSIGHVPEQIRIH